MNPGASASRIPENVSVKDRARVTAGFANEVEAVNQEKAEGCNEFTEELRWTAANVLRQGEDWETKHEVRHDGSGEGSCDLSEHVVRVSRQAISALESIRECDGGV
jgi:hypothetical protein